MRNPIIFVVFLFIGAALFAQDFDKAKMDSLFGRIENNQKGMGSVSIFKNGEEVYHHSTGFADVEQGLKADQNTTYRIGSISKMFTAVLVMQLVEEGKLQLDSKLSEFYPEIPNAEKISIENLLRHHSGIFNFTNDPGYVRYMESPKTKTELLEIFKQQEPVFEPGKNSEYSNTNYVLLTFIIEDITNKDFSEVLKERIVQPLDLKHTYYGGKIDPSHNEALSYNKMYGWQLATETDMSIPKGAGAIVSTPTDLNRFLAALFTGKLVKEPTLKTMMTLADGFGIGMFQVPFYQQTAYGHTGGIDGFQSMASYFPDQNVSVAYISNGTVMPVNDIAIGVLSIYFGKEYDLPVFDPDYEVSAEELKQYLGVYGSETFPLKITISQNENGLMAQATGQGAFPLTASEKDKFKFDPAGIELEFIPEENKMILLQGGGRYELVREP